MRQFQRVNMILDLTSDQLGINSADYLTLIQMTRLSTDSNEVFVSQTQLAKRLSKSRVSTNTSIKNLAKAGLIRINKLEAETGGRLANSYTLLLDRICEVAQMTESQLKRSSNESVSELFSRYIKGDKLAICEMQRLVDSNTLSISDNMLLNALILKSEEHKKE